MKKTRKVVRMMVAVSVPLDLTAAQARREVREMIRGGAGWWYSCGDGNVVVKAVRPVR